MSKSEHGDPQKLEERALTMRTVGWLLLVFDFLILSVFIFVGFRTGSYMWFFWAVIQGAVGAGLVVAGMQREELAGYEIGEEAEPHVEAGDLGQKAA